MALTLSQYQTLSTGLTQQDTEFRDALIELSENTNVDFYDYRRNAFNRLNHELVGQPVENEHPVKIVGMIDYPNNTLVMSRFGEEVEYNLDELDPRYLATINQTAVMKGRKPERLPITDIAAEMLDDLNKDVEQKPAVDEYSLTSSREILKRAFSNEMVLQVEMEDFIKDNKIESKFNDHSDKLTHLVDKKSYEASFNDGLKDLNKSVASTKKKGSDLALG